MKRVRVVVPWPTGIHLRTAAVLVRVVRGFRASAVARCAGDAADLRSALSVMALCATMGTPLVVEADGEDEEAVIQAVQQVFASDLHLDATEGTRGVPG